MKECKKCKEVKEETDFPETINGNKATECKLCRSIYLKAYYKVNKRNILDNQKIRYDRQKDRERNRWDFDK